MKIKAKMDNETFIEIFFEICKRYNFRTYRDAYERAELQHELMFGCRRYSSYDSFRVIKDGKSKNSL